MVISAAPAMAWSLIVTLKWDSGLTERIGVLRLRPNSGVEGGLAISI